MIKSNKFWSYESCSSYEIKDDILLKMESTGKFIDDVSHFYELIGKGIHPSLKWHHKTDNPTVINFNNILIDINTLKFLFFLLEKFSSIKTLKFINNNLNIISLKYMLNSLLNKEKENFLLNIYYEYNTTIVINNQKYYYNKINEIKDEIIKKEILLSKELICDFINIENIIHLCLRGNDLGDMCAKMIFENIKNQGYKSTIKILNLFKNNLSDICIEFFCEMMLINESLEEINLGQNFLSNKSLKLIKDNYGIFLMNNDEVMIYKNKEKEKQDIIKQNIKLKSAGKPELKVPFLYKLKEIKGEYYKVKNDTLKIFNLIRNKFTKDSFDDLVNILNNNEKCIIYTDGKIYNEQQINILKGISNKNDFSNRIYLMK